jgi:ribonuclease HI
MDIVNIHTDGSGVNNPKLPHYGHGGCGVVMRWGDRYAEHAVGTFRNTTSARMEIFAIIRALELVKPGFEIRITTDNQYCQKTIGFRWLDNWLAHSCDKKNLDLWQRYKEIEDKHIIGGSVIKVRWVRGHNGNKDNERADELATEGRMKTQEIYDDRLGIYTCV